MILIFSVILMSGCKKEKEICVLNDPPEITKGRIERYYRAFSSDEVIYYLFYVGKMEQSGEECGRWIPVTKRGYEHRMYGIGW